MKAKIIPTVLVSFVLGLSLIGCASPARHAPDERDAIAPFPSVDEGENPSSPVVPDIPDVPDAPDSNGAAQERPPEDGTDAPANAPSDEKPTVAPPKDDFSKTDVLLCSTTNGLNVRRGAGASYAVLGVLDKGDMVMPVGRSGAWYEILYMGGRAYVSASYLTEVSFRKASDATERVIAEGKKLLGIPYVYGAQRYHFGNGILNTRFDGKSYDCSSLTQYIFKLGANKNLGMTSREQSLQGREIKRGEIRRGDLLFFTNSSRFDKTGLERIGHVALYLGDNIILHTASDHAVIEPITDLRSSYFITARRLLD